MAHRTTHRAETVEPLFEYHRAIPDQPGCIYIVMPPAKILPPTARSCRYEFRSLAGAYLSRCLSHAVEHSWVYDLVGSYRVLGGGVRPCLIRRPAGDTA
jgi:hypothetical protein